MQKPNTPSLEPSEPEIERMLAQDAMNKIKNDGFDGIQIYLPYVKDYLHKHGLDVDENGFIINKESGEHATPYIFIEDLVSEYVKDDDESIFDAFFRPVTDDLAYGWNEHRVHLTDLHSVIKTSDGESHPVRDGSFNIAKLHATLETRFKTITGWSDIVKKENIDKNGQWLGMAKGFDESNETENELEINCINPDCGYSGSVSSWSGNEHTSPVCPECDGEWDSEGISVCTLCETWYWGQYFEGESIHAKPACANCGADMEYIERILRYDDVDSFEELVKNNRPKYSVVGIDEDGDIDYTFDHCDTKADAMDEKSFAEDISGTSGFNDVEKVEVRERDCVTSVSQYELDTQE